MGPGTRPWQRPAEGEKRHKASPGELLAPLCSHRRHARGKEKARAAVWPLRKQTALGGWAIKCHHLLSLVGEEENLCRASRQDFRVTDGEVSLKLGSPQKFLLKCEIFQLLMGEKREAKARGSSYRAQSKDIVFYIIFGGQDFPRVPVLPKKPPMDRAPHIPRTAVPLGGIVLKSFGKWGQLT